MSICPSSNLDPWADDQLVDPYEGYKELRALGPVVYLERHDVYAVVSHEAARQVLQNWEIFSSASGVGLSPTMNERGAGGVLTSDPPQHTPLRGVLNRQLIPPEVKRHRDALADRADRLVDAIVSEPFDAVEDLAVPYSVGVVGDLVGIPDDRRSQLVERAAAAFNTFGPDNQLSVDSRPLFSELFWSTKYELTPEVLRPGGWGREIYEAGEAGALEPDACPGLMLAYLWAGMDTTVNGIASAVSLFAEHPDEWLALRADPTLVLSAVREVLRFEPPVQRFARTTTATSQLDGVEIPDGSIVAILFGAANRDAAHYTDAERFDITRNPVDHLAFGLGIHRCVGAGLAQEEMAAVFAALVQRVESFEILDRQMRRNNALHGPSRLLVRCI